MSRAVILDRYGNCIHNLTQWDSNRLIILDDFEYDIAPVFHFCNTTSYEALVVNGKLSGRQASAEIPNQLLETSNTILVYVCLCDSNNNIIETVKYFELPVHKKAKPNDYVYVKNTDYISILGLKEQLDKSVKQADKLITEASDMLLDIDDRLKNIDYQSLINNPKTPMNTESNTESRGSYELTESCTFTFKSGDKNNGYTDYEIIAEKGSLYFCSGNIGNEWHKLLLCQSGLYYCHYFDMEYEYFSLQDLVALANINSVLGAFVENVQNTISEMINDEEITNQTTYSSEKIERLIKGHAKEYGVCYNSNTASPTLQRVGAAVGMVAGTGQENETNIVNDFDKVHPWSDIKRCTKTNDGTITSYKGDANYTEDGSIGDVMVEIPKFYIKRIVEQSSGLVYRYICKEKLEGYHTPPAFIDENGNEIDKIYISAYGACIKDDGVHSCIGSDYYIDDSRYPYLSDAREKLKEKGQKWHILDLATLEIIQSLFIIEFATLDCKSVFAGCGSMDIDIEYTSNAEFFGQKENIFTPSIEVEIGTFMAGQEICFYSENPENFNSPENTVYSDENLTYCHTTRKITAVEYREESTDEATGVTKGVVDITFDGSTILCDESLKIWHTCTHGCTNVIKASSGELGCYKVGGRPFVWRGIENFYGLDDTFVDGFAMNRRKMYVNYTPSTYDENIKTAALLTSNPNYHELSYTLPTKNGYILNMGYDADYPWAVLPIDSSGTSDTGYCDKVGGVTGLATVVKAMTLGNYLLGLHFHSISSDINVLIRMVCS